MITTERRLSKAERIAGLTETLRKRPGERFTASELKKCFNGDTGQVVGKNHLHSLLEDVPGVTITGSVGEPIFCWTGDSK
jgi:hypothetical protein